MASRRFAGPTGCARSRSLVPVPEPFAGRPLSIRSLHADREADLYRRYRRAATRRSYDACSALVNSPNSALFKSDTAQNDMPLWIH